MDCLFDLPTYSASKSKALSIRDLTDIIAEMIAGTVPQMFRHSIWCGIAFDIRYGMTLGIGYGMVFDIRNDVRVSDRVSGRTSDRNDVRSG